MEIDLVPPAALPGAKLLKSLTNGFFLIYTSNQFFPAGFVRTLPRQFQLNRHFK
jgi:hypothetical protein